MRFVGNRLPQCPCYYHIMIKDLDVMRLYTVAGVVLQHTHCQVECLPL